MTDPTLEDAIRRIEKMDEESLGITAESSGFGSFVGIPAQIEFELDGRAAKLMQQIEYTSDDGTNWTVPVGAWLDGASIPRAFWTLIGGPYEGNYREPSIVHDHFCIVRTREWRDTHRMFHQAMRCRGVSPYKAKVMFYAVHRFGPRWTVGSVSAEASVGAIQPTEPDAASILADASKIGELDLDLSWVEALAERSRGFDEGR